MKEKLLKLIMQNVITLKDNSSDIVLDLNDDNKESVYNELLVPLMTITGANSASDLRAKLDTFINGNAETSEYAEMAAKFIESLIDDMEESTNLDDEVNNLIVNCVAVLNSFNNIIEKSDNKETSLDSITVDILTFMNTDTNSDSNDDNNDEAGKQTQQDGGASNTNDASDAGPVSSLVITSAADSVDDGSWADVNKIELKNMLKDKLDAKEQGIEDVINEVFALVKSMDNVADWQWPHHVVKDGKVLLNVNGLKTSALFLLKPASSKNLTTDQRTSIAAHILKHYKEIQMKEPDKLVLMASGKESSIIINIKEDDMKDFSETFKVPVEDIGTYIGLMESLLTDFVNSGVLNVQGDLDESNESLITLKLNKEQTEEFIKYFDIISDDVVSILSNNFMDISYKKEAVSDIEAKYLQEKDNSSALAQKLVDAEATNREMTEQLNKFINDNNIHSLNMKKFEAIINFVKSVENVDESLIQWVNNVVEAQEEKEIGYLVKLGLNFMKNTKSNNVPKFVKNMNVGVNFRTSDVDRLTDLIGDDLRTNNESSNFSGKSAIDKRIEALSLYFD